MTLKMTTAQVVETSVTVTNSSFQNYTRPDDHTTRITQLCLFSRLVTNFDQLRGDKRCIFQQQGKNGVYSNNRGQNGFIPTAEEQVEYSQTAGGHKVYITTDWEQRGIIPIARGHEGCILTAEGKRSVF